MFTRKTEPLLLITVSKFLFSKKSQNPDDIRNPGSFLSPLKNLTNSPFGPVSGKRTSFAFPFSHRLPANLLRLPFNNGPAVGIYFKFVLHIIINQLSFIFQPSVISLQPDKKVLLRGSRYTFQNRGT